MRGTLVTCRQVLVHLVTNSGSPGRTLADIISGLNIESQAQLLDAGERDGISYLVTVPIPGFTTLPAWLGQGSGAEVPLVQKANDLAFTQLFNQPPANVPFAATPPPVKAGDPGEFTQFFRRPPEAGFHFRALHDGELPLTLPKVWEPLPASYFSATL